MKLNDPTIDTIEINTVNEGNFEKILNLNQFDKISFEENEIPFLNEIFEIFGLTIDDIFNNFDRKEEINNENIISNTKRHEKFKIYSNLLKEDIEYISSHFYELYETGKEFLLTLLPSTIERIISNEKLKLTNEDQLFNFIFEFYNQQNSNSNSNEITKFFGYLIFSNLSEETMKIFIDNFDYNELDHETWKSLTNRLTKPILNQNSEPTKRYKENIQQISQPTKNSKEQIFNPQQENEFNGIINYLKTKGNISNQLEITASSICFTDYPPKNVIDYQNRNHFCTKNEPGSWICFDFKENKIIPTNYQIMSFNGGQNCEHPKSWQIQGSNDETENKNWTTIDEQTNCPILNGSNITHIFPISNSIAYRYIRMIQTDKNWADSCHLLLDSFEFYGKLISTNQ